MATLDLLVTAAIIIAAIVALWDRWRFFQFLVVCAVVETNYFWHWDQGNPFVPLIAGIVLAALITAIYIDVRDGKPQAFVRKQWRNLLSLGALIGEPLGLLRRDHAGK